MRLLKSYRASQVTAYLGSNVRTAPLIARTVDSDYIIQHSGYNAQYYTNDIAIVEIPMITLNDKIAVVRLPAIATPSSTYAGSYGLASGWGFTMSGKFIIINISNI